MKYFFLAFLFATAPAMACSLTLSAYLGASVWFFLREILSRRVRHLGVRRYGLLRISSTRVRASGSLYGACTAGLSPVNNDRQPVDSPSDGNRTYGNTCSFDIDCSPGGHCSKETICA
jgi:hypothetical protein